MAFQPEDWEKRNQRMQAYQREYYLAHKAKKIVYQRQYWSLHKDEANARRRKERTVHHRWNIPKGVDYNKKYHSEIVVEKRFRRRVEAFRRIGPLKCVSCGTTNFLVLTINHKNGGGRQEYRQSSYDLFLKNIVEGKRRTDDLEIRCMNCNNLYEYERGTRLLPHDWEDILLEGVICHGV